MPDPLMSARRLPVTPCRARTLGAVPVQLAGPVVEEPFSDVQLGPLLGKGAFGKVHKYLLASQAAAAWCWWPGTNPFMPH